MIAVDTCSMVAYLQGESGSDVELLDEMLRHKQVVLPPVVLTELLSDATLTGEITSLFRSLPVLDLSVGYWERTGATRAIIMAKGYKARIADALITQSCLDHRMSLLTRDADFKAFERLCGLSLFS